jgi:hypothetical protein
MAVLGLALLGRPAFCGDGDWVLYENPSVGLTFRHPPDLRTREAADYVRTGLNAKAVIELVGRTEQDPDTIVLRFIVEPFQDPPFRSDWNSAGEYLAHERAGCNSSTYLSIDGHRALNCVSCGRAACSWMLILVERLRLNILSFADAETFGKRTAMRPHDGRFPILSILRTLHITADSAPLK